MTYAIIENGKVAEYPVYEGDIKLSYPNVSFPTPFVPPEGYVRVEDVVPPACDYRENITEGEPTLVGGVWSRNWIVVDASGEEIAERINNQWSGVRVERNQRLANCDWTQLPDAPLTNEQTLVWTTYRQALRDITEQQDPFNIIWPEAL